MSDSLQQFAADNWDQSVLHAGTPVAVEFWAEWCAPCRLMEPMLEQLASNFAGRATLGKLDIDANAALAERYEILGVPTIIVFDKGEVKEKTVGVIDEDYLTEIIEKYV